MIIQIPYEKIIEKIKTEGNLSEEEIENKIKEKLDKLSGLISREGAAHIIASELGIKIMEDVIGRLKIRDILTGMRNLETLGKIIDIYEIREFDTGTRKGKVGSFIIGDETSTIRVVAWGEKTDEIKNLKKGDILKIEGAYSKENNGRKEIHLGDKAEIIINPEGEVIANVNKVTTQKRKINELKSGEINVELLGTIVQAKDIRFYEVCPTCKKRAKLVDNSFKCEEHGEVEPAYNYVMNIILDDGTGNIRIALFSRQTENLLGKSDEEIQKYRENPAEFEAVKTDLLGEIVKIIGRVSQNEMFDRLEVVAQLVFKDVDIKEEIEELKKEIKA